MAKALTLRHLRELALDELGQLGLAMPSFLENVLTDVTFSAEVGLVERLFFLLERPSLAKDQ